jgi:ribosome-associated toxin RatA of RatAB toxin-antitoxin module
MRVRAPRDRVFEEVLDVRAYPRLIPGVVEARLVEDTPERRVVYLRHQLAIVSAAYHAVVRVDRPAHTVRFDLDRTRPADVRAGRGFVSVTPYRGTESIVTWGVMADPGSAILRGVFGGVIQDWILKVPWCVRGRLEPGQPGC